jgi:uncharacterized protein YeaO (DUF488 family)
MTIRSKRVYDQPSPDDGFRVLIDGLWPRGVSHERASIDLWAREHARAGGVTIVFAARDAEHSNATVLVDVLRRGLRGGPR